MLKKVLLLALVTSWVLSLQAQEADETPVISPVVKKATKVDRIDFNLSAGTSYMYSKDFGSGMSSYVAPELTYKLTPKIRINVGIMFLNSNLVYNKYRSMMNEQSVVIRTKPTTSTLAFVSGDYLVNDRLTVSGMLMRDLSSPQGFGKNSYSPSIQAMSLNLDYKLTDNISIGAGMHMSKGGYFGSPSSNYGIYPSSQFNPLFGY